MSLKFKMGMVAVSWIWGFLQFFCIEVYHGIWLYVLFVLEIAVAVF